MIRLQQIDASLVRLDRRRKQLLRERNELLSHKMLTCKGCGRRMRLDSIVYIQTRFYVRPHGCTEGDYWKDGEGQWRCKHCGFINRLYDKPEIEKLKHLFLRIEYHKGDW